MPIWVGATILAGLFQTWRTALQQKLRGQLSVNAAAVVRYLYGVPVGMVFVTLYLTLIGGSLSSPSWTYALYCALGGLGQIIGTNLLIMSFGHRGFAVGTAYSKTEAVQAAFIALIFLGESFAPLAWLGIAVSVGGTLYLSLAGRVSSTREVLAATMQPSAIYGLGAGFAFALCALAIRAATQTLDGPDATLRALETLVVINMMQTVMQGGWLVATERSSIPQLFSTWRSSAQVGALSACGSACWFTGFAYAPVALVRAVGQVEILFTLLFSRFFLKERMKRTDVIGALTVVAGVVLVLLGR
ncbi:EamA family transporter [Neoroseomonas oryzicola]|uniref:EamA family transporter n=1 Tax=Neoroseomonas oryzicola TaxID=535904 RepID=A0A9X9WMB2_9PROT|nr:EamA family transporter [Neoroseomonas oryzicola]MBR0661472.1 EamA family transporter [Neoroseomonas oryzicola]NKE19959.1 EamA family transporter [Neoroseomonas oryzicola]